MITQAIEDDGPLIHDINIFTGIFSKEKVERVDELWVEYQTLGPETSGYLFLVDKDGEDLLGYSCSEPRALTNRPLDLYWIVFDCNIQGGRVSL